MRNKVLIFWRRWGRKNYEAMYLRGWRNAQAWLEYVTSTYPEVVEAGYHHPIFGKVYFKRDEEEVEPSFECLRR